MDVCFTDVDGGRQFGARVLLLQGRKRYGPVAAMGL